MESGGGRQLSLDALLVVTEALAGAVTAGFGPSFKSTLVVSSAGKLLVTNSGVRILRSLAVDHPCARLIVECARRHHDLTGDNTKSFVVLLHEMLRLARLRLADGGGSGPPSQMAPPSDGPQQLLATELGQTLADSLPKLLRRLHEQAVVRRTAADVSGFRDGLLDVIRGGLGCHLLEYDVQSLSALVRDYVLGWTPDGDARRLPQILDVVTGNFGLLCVQGGNKPTASSRVIDGMLLSRCCHFAPPAYRRRRRPLQGGRSVPEAATGDAEQEQHAADRDEGVAEDVDDDDDALTRFLVMSCSIEGDDDDYCSDDGDAPTAVTSDARLILDAVPGGGGRSGVCGALAKAFAARAERVGRFLAQCSRAGVTLLVTTRMLSELERRLCDEHGVDYVHAVPDDEAQLLATLAGVPLVHDAAECLLHGRLPPTAVGRARDCIQLATAAGGAVYSNLVGLRTAACCARTLVMCAPTEGLCQQLYDCVLDALRCVRSALVVGEEHACCHGSAAGGSGSGADDYADGFGGGGGGGLPELTLCTFPVGGAFEIGLHHQIVEHLAASGGHGSAALRLVADALLSVPRTLYDNAYSFAKPRWPATLLELRASCLAGRAEGVHASTGTSARLGGALHPFRSKQLLVLHVVALARQLLKTDFILPAAIGRRMNGYP